MLELIDAKCSDTASWTSASGENLVLDRGAIKDTNYKAVHFTGYKNGSRVTESTGNGQANVSLSDLLKNETQFNLSVESCKGERTPFVQAANYKKNLLGQVKTQHLL